MGKIFTCSIFFSQIPNFLIEFIYLTNPKLEMRISKIVLILIKL
jgi:hypothetical protein